jgi:hypothetical protein
MVGAGSVIEFSAWTARAYGSTAGAALDWALVSHTVWVTWTPVAESTQVTEYQAPGVGPPAGKPPSLLSVRSV